MGRFAACPLPSAFTGRTLGLTSVGALWIFIICGALAAIGTRSVTTSGDTEAALDDSPAMSLSFSLLVLLAFADDGPGMSKGDAVSADVIFGEKASFSLSFPRGTGMRMGDRGELPPRSADDDDAADGDGRAALSSYFLTSEATRSR